MRSFRTPLKILFVTAFAAGILYLTYLFADESVVLALVRQFGYAGIFLGSILSGINIAVPIPIISFLPLFVESGLSIWLTVILISLGLTVGDSVSYGFGMFGRELFTPKLEKRMEYLAKLRDRHRRAPQVALLFFAALMPLPNELMIIPLALLGYRWIELIPFALAGNLVFNTIAAFGLTNLFQVIFR